MVANVGTKSGVGREKRKRRCKKRLEGREAGAKKWNVILRSCAMKKLCLGGCIIDIIPV